MKNQLLAACAFLAASSFADGWRDMMWLAPVSPREGVTARAYRLEEPRKMAAYVVRVDLTTPGLSFTATGKAADWGRDLAGTKGDMWRAETTAETTPGFMRRMRGEGRNVCVAVNTTPWKPWPMPKGESGCDPLGSVVTEGEAVSATAKSEAAFIVRRDGSCEIADTSRLERTDDILFAQNSFCFIMTNGVDALTGRLDESERPAPRTALGLTADRKTLVILAVDGRQGGYSEGATMEDLRAMMRREGVADAVNMDGGGSTSLVVFDPAEDAPVMLNRHAGGSVRPVAVNLGIAFDAPQTGTGRRESLYHSYEFAPIEDAPAPEGFKPFYIGHYGRHGSRRLTGTFVADTLATLERGATSGRLTPAGEELLAAMRRLGAAHDGMVGELAERGAAEHRELARRMAARFPSVFEGPCRIRCRSTNVPRVLVSMANFTMSLKESVPEARFDFTTGDRLFHLLCGGHFIENKKDVENLVKGKVASLAAETIPADGIVARFFKAPGDAGDAMKFVRDLFVCAADCQCVRIETDGLDLFRFLRPGEIDALSRCLDAEMYGLMVDSAETGDSFMHASAPLGLDFVERGEDAIADGRVAADLRFGHDQGVWSLAAFFGLAGPDAKVPLADAWQGCPVWKWSPMAANLQMVLYRNAGGEVLVKFLYNEREMALRGLEPVSGPYYGWTAFKEYIAGKVKGLQ